jgi:hypothetical protein
MKPVSSFLHRTPWWLLLGGGFVLFLALAIFTTPVHLMRLDESGKSAEENRAIKREIDAAFSEGAIDIARGVVREMRDHTTDPARREELERALEEIDEARANLREAGAEVLRAKRQAAEDASDAVKDAAAAIQEAQKQAERALKEAGVENDRVKKSLEESLKAAREAQEEAKRSAAEARAQAQKDAREAREKALQAAREARDAARAHRGRGPQEDSAPPEISGIAQPPAPPRVVVMGPGGDKPLIDIDMDKGTASVAPLPPELKQEIRRKIHGDVYRMGLGAGLILLFIPIFILLVVSKFFIDRSRAAQRVAEMKRKEADYARMSQQVTEAKLSALQAQVEPHFLYNTLASVQALTEVDPSQANAMTGHLIQYLRNALPKMRESVSTVGQEVELVRAYLNILQMRMGKRLSFEIAVPQELMELPFPPLMLPSLVENAIKHGLEPQREGGSVHIGALVDGATLRMIVADTGRGFGETLGAGVGLTNIRERLAALYGESAKLTLEANHPHGVVATIEVPRDGARISAAAAAAIGASVPPPVSPQPEAPRTATAKTLRALGTAERAWRRGLSFTFIGLVVVAAVIAGLAMVGTATGLLPVHFGSQEVTGPTRALIGTAGVAAAFAVVVLCLAIVLAVVYGLGFLFVGLAIFIPLVVLVSLFPVLAPFILVGLGIWWFVRRSRRRRAAEAMASERIEPTAAGAAEPQAPTP